MKERVQGTCLCGNVRFELEGECTGFFLCHCQYCQKDTGSAHAANLFFKEAKLHWLSGEQNVTHYNLFGTRHRKSFCSLCGSAMPHGESAKHFIVPAGCLDGKLGLRPEAHIFMGSRASWEKGFDELIQYEAFPVPAS